MAGFLALMLSSCTGTSQQSESIKFYVGSSGNQQHSIFLCELDPELQKFAVLDSFSGAAGASYLAPSPYNKILYTINQEIYDADQKHSSVSSFAVDPETLALKYINSQSSEGRGICHIHCSQDGDYIVCYHCGDRVHESQITIGQGSCPPAPLDQTYGRFYVTITLADLEQGKRFFV